MGKASRQMKKKQKNKEEQAINMANRETEEKLREQMEHGEYEKAIETIAELVQAGDVKPEFMYDAAYSYFMAGDYDRSANWVTNTLTADPGHIDARILLARLCILQDRPDDGLAVFDFILENYGAALSDEKKEEIEEIVAFYGRNEKAKIVRDYPHIAKFLRLDGENAEPEDKAAALLSSLKAKVAEASEKAAQVKEQAVAAKDKAVEAVAGAADAAADAAAKKPADILQALRAKLAEVKEEAGEKIAGAVSKPAAEPKAAPQDSESHTAAEVMLREVEAQNTGAARKIEMLNSFAGGLYLERDLKGAELLLSEALKTDTQSDYTLRNMALLQLEMGNREKALKFASLMKQADFLLLRTLR